MRLRKGIAVLLSGALLLAQGGLGGALAASFATRGSPAARGMAPVVSTPLTTSTEGPALSLETSALTAPVSPTPTAVLEPATPAVAAP
ncbi:MAG TPA: hypothetical protein VNI01_06120, partial [Elusimicrobiota bacterium]|nr:hypothetical protein [Elusimicrobiota bacterium]